MQNIVIKGARVNNLKNIDVTIPKNKLVVITGLSGSGKSSLAFDIIYAEGQRRYVESLSTYARQFLGQMDKPDVDSIEGLSPTIAIDQKTTNRNPRSTVGTITEIYDYLRLFFSRVGKIYCPKHNKEISSQTLGQIAKKIMEYPSNTKFYLLSPLVKAKKGQHVKLLQEIQERGFVRIRKDGEICELTKDLKLDATKKHTIEVVVDRLILKEGVTNRLISSLETALNLSDGQVIVFLCDSKEELYFNTKACCPVCGYSVAKLEPRMFSFNNPIGACSTCSGLGVVLDVDSEKIFANSYFTLKEFALEFEKNCRFNALNLEKVFNYLGLDANLPLGMLKEDVKKTLLDGINDGKFYFKGLISLLKSRYYSFESEILKNNIKMRYMVEQKCPSCNGCRLKQESLIVFINGLNIADVTSLTIREVKDFLEGVSFLGKEKVISLPILKELNERLDFLIDVGVEYLTLNRSSETLSGGEAQRIRLATQIGSKLTGVIYVLDEPSIGLHQRDNERLLATLRKLKNLGNSVIVVEHDEETMLASDYLIDIGPYAGDKGGRIVFQGTPKECLTCSDEKRVNSLTCDYLSGRRFITVPAERSKGNGKFLELRGVRENNLKNITVRFPLETFICVTGVSGSGKSTLINTVLSRALTKHLYNSLKKPGEYDEIVGLENIEKLVIIDQAPIGKTPRSNPATYVGVFDDIRLLFSSTKEAKARGYTKSRFSFNVSLGRCDACNGDGVIKVEMHFLPDVYVQCDVCKGSRYKKETLEIKYKGKNISDVLNMTVDTALSFFENIPNIKRKLKILQDVGLGYIKLGQASNTLSGGEAQRVKLAAQLHKKSNSKTLYILDEPTTGLHFDDVARLLLVLKKLVLAQGTVIVIEHNLDVIKSADYVIDLGPEGGAKGGNVVACGTPEEIASNAKSYTGQFLKKVLNFNNGSSNFANFR